METIEISKFYKKFYKYIYRTNINSMEKFGLMCTILQHRLPIKLRMPTKGDDSILSPHITDLLCCART